VVVAYLENDLKSWPAWRKKHGDGMIPTILDAVQERFQGSSTRVVLAGHSGGGSLIFGYMNVVETIPDRVERVAFLDANYGYETDLHRDKLAAWLKASDRNYLVVLAYNDAVALLNGKTFVSAAGGTWGRSYLMLRDLEGSFPFAKDLTDDVQRFTALARRTFGWRTV
jgi:pimeloyl-ACP methyl ester carboxylesterase